MKKIIITLILAVFAAACSQGIVDEDAPSEAPSAAESKVHNPHADGTIPLDKNGQPVRPVKKERKFSIPKEVSEKYKSLILEVRIKLRTAVSRQMSSSVRSQKLQGHPLKFL